MHTKTANPGWPRRSADIVLIVLFIAALFLPAAGKLLHLDKTLAPPEKRRLAPRPKLLANGRSLAALPAEFDAYCNDRFGFRNSLIRWHNRVKVRLLRTSPSEMVILGSDGYLYFGGDSAREYYRSLRPFEEEELAQWKRALEQRRDWLAAQGIRYLVVIAPSKDSIYPEHMPAALNRVTPESRLDQLVRYLGANADFRVLDLREPLLQAKKHDQVYGLADSHWNDLGAYVAYRAIMERVATWYPKSGPLPLSAFDIVKTRTQGIDLAELLGMEDTIRDDYVTLVPKTPRQAKAVNAPVLLPLRDWGVTPPIVMEREKTDLPRAVMLRDSFAIRLIPFMSEHFSRIAYLWKYDFDTDAIRLERPNIVVHEIAERYLMLDWSLPAADESTGGGENASVTLEGGDRVSISDALAAMMNAVVYVRRRARNRLLLARLGGGGRGVFVADPRHWDRPANVFLGNDVFFGVESFVGLGKSRLYVGNGVLFGPQVMIIGGDHNYLSLGKRMWESTVAREGDIRIGDDVWCGARAVILRGVEIGEGTVVGACSVVTRSLPPFVVAAGNPCQPRRLRFSDEELMEHLRRLGHREADATSLVVQRRSLAGDLPVAPAQTEG